MTWVDPDDPPILVVHGDADRTVPLAHAEAIRDAYRAADAECEYLVLEGVGHEVRDPVAMRVVAVFLDRHLGGAAALVTDRAATDRP